jgi:thiol-disulfide isomerase/thioredoxin
MVRYSIAMNKSLIFVILGCLVVAVGVGFFTTRGQSPTAVTTQMGLSGMVEKNTPALEAPDHGISPGPTTKNYLKFSPAIFAESTNFRRVLFFYANWCPTCKAADAELLAKVDQIPSDVLLIQVNYNDTETEPAEKELAKKYFITYQHTFVQIDAQGNELAKWNGGAMEELLGKLK